MWYTIFMWALFSSVFVHFIAASIAFGMLWKHKLGRFTAVIILLFGILAPITGGVITSKYDYTIFLKRVCFLSKISFRQIIFLILHILFK